MPETAYKGAPFAGDDARVGDDVLELEYENGCIDHADAAPQAWPDWQSATIAGGDVPPTRVVSDPYPTMHSVAVDPEHDRMFMSDPNRHAIWSYPRLAASKGAEAVTPLTSIRGPSTFEFLLDRRPEVVSTVTQRRV